jgi:hypothetical protein
LEYYVEGKTKPQRENLSVKLRVNPPAEIYLQGDKPLVSKAIVVASNEREFWLAIRPKISLYCWGLWSEQDSGGGLVINPRTLLEALGIEQIDAGQDWSLSNEGAFDVLTKRERGVVTCRAGQVQGSLRGIFCPRFDKGHDVRPKRRRISVRHYS